MEPMDMSSRSPMKETVVMMVGKTGQGKSATGNTILGKTIFEESDSSESCTHEIARSSTERFGRVLTVLDGPGTLETQFSVDVGLQKMAKKMEESIQDHADGINALLLVTKYPNGFTEPQHSTVQTLKAVLGDRVFQDFGIVVFTYGELFDMKYEGRKNFQEWIREQNPSSEMRKLLEECSHRTLLFRNSLDNETEVENMLEMIDKLNTNGARYTSEMFDRAKKPRNTMIEKIAEEHRHENFQKKIRALKSSLENVEKMFVSPEDAKKQLHDLSSRLKDVANETLAMNEERELSDLVKTAQDIGETIESHRQMVERYREEEDKVLEKYRDLAKKLEVESETSLSSTLVDQAKKVGNTVLTKTKSLLPSSKKRKGPP